MPTSVGLPARRGRSLRRKRRVDSPAWGGSMRLVHPSLVWKEVFLELALDHANAGEPRYELALRDFDGYLRKVEVDTEARPDQPNWVPQSEFWLGDAGILIGVIRIRYWLTKTL